MFLGLALFLARQSSRLHGENFDFDAQFDTLSSKLLRKPRQYFLLGFQDSKVKTFSVE